MREITIGELLVKLYHDDKDVEHFEFGRWWPVRRGDRPYQLLQKTKKHLTLSEMAACGHPFRVTTHPWCQW